MKPPDWGLIRKGRFVIKERGTGEASNLTCDWLRLLKISGGARTKKVAGKVFLEEECP
jgi:hypothetical protein